MQWLIELRLVQITQTRIKKIENFSNLKANVIFVQFWARESWEKLHRRNFLSKTKTSKTKCTIERSPQCAYLFQSFHDLAEDAKSASAHMNGHSFILRLLSWNFAYENLLRCDISITSIEARKFFSFILRHFNWKLVGVSLCCLIWILSQLLNGEKFASWNLSSPDELKQDKQFLSSFPSGYSWRSYRA